MRAAASEPVTLPAAPAQGGGFGGWLLLAVIAVACAVLFAHGFLYVLEQWQREEYSYGYIVPPITALLVWSRLPSAPAAEPGRIAAWIGVVLVLLAVLIAPLARIAGMPSAAYYAFLIALYGLFLAALGWRRTWHVTPALAYLIFALPLPQTLYLKLSTALQSVSSIGSVELMRLFGVKVLRQGNIIDLGTYQLQVAEACSGLGYLFPLLSFAYLLAYLYRGGWWGRAVILTATIPITLAINILRIAITGVLVDYVGVAAAEGFIHAFEGYTIFAVGALLFLALIWLMGRLTGHRGPLLQLLRFEQVFPRGGGAAAVRPALTRPLLAGTVLLAIGATAALAMPGVTVTPPARQSLATFPMRIEGWRGSEGRIEPNFLAILKLDDYLLADYRDEQSGGPPVNLYVAYYKAQNENATIHSPKVCIPAGGWEISDLRPHTVPGLGEGGLTVNRAVIGKGVDRQLVYYWFELRGRRMTGEYAIKLLNLWDGLTRQRTDGALVRLTTPLPPGDAEAAADARLAAFLRSVYPQLAAHIPS